MQLNWPTPSDFPTLSAGEVHVWAVRRDAIATPQSELTAMLSGDERERADRFARDDPRRVFVVSRAALRSILGSYLKLSPGRVPIHHLANGKPLLETSGLHFNLAHSGDLTLIAVTRQGEVGVDVELIRPIDHLQEIAARNFHPAERDALLTIGAAELPATFMRCWTRKEAVLKAIGTGVGYPLSAFDVLTRVHPDLPVELPRLERVPSTHVYLNDLDPCPGYTAALATIHAVVPPGVFGYPL